MTGIYGGSCFLETRPGSTQEAGGVRAAETGKSRGKATSAVRNRCRVNSGSVQIGALRQRIRQIERLRAIGREGQPHLGKRRLEVGEFDRQRPHGALEIVIHFSEDPAFCGDISACAVKGSHVAPLVPKGFLNSVKTAGRAKGIGSQAFAKFPVTHRLRRRLAVVSC
jgi:hypothetical protein